MYKICALKVSAKKKFKSGEKNKGPERSLVPGSRLVREACCVLGQDTLFTLLKQLPSEMLAPIYAFIKKCMRLKV